MSNNKKQLQKNPVTHAVQRHFGHRWSTLRCFAIPREKGFIESLRLQIVPLDAEHKKPSKIASKLNHSVHVVNTFLRDSNGYDKKRHEKQHVLHDRTIPTAIRTIMKQLKSCAKQVLKLNQPERTQKMWNNLSSRTTVSHVATLKTIKLTQTHCNAGVHCCVNHAYFSKECNKVVFSDKKWFNWNSPDRYKRV